jgi:hypothetical protein
LYGYQQWLAENPTESLMLIPRAIEEADWVNITGIIMGGWQEQYDAFVLEYPEVRSTKPLDIFPAAFPSYLDVKGMYYDVNFLAVFRFEFDAEGNFAPNVDIAGMFREIGKIVTREKWSPMSMQRMQAATNYQQELKMKRGGTGQKYCVPKTEADILNEAKQRERRGKAADARAVLREERNMRSFHPDQWGMEPLVPTPLLDQGGKLPTKTPVKVPKFPDTPLIIERAVPTTVSTMSESARQSRVSFESESDRQDSSEPMSV